MTTQTIATIYGRRAVKSFRAGEAIAPSVLQTILDAAMASPSSFNLQHWRFVIVRDPVTRAQLRRAGHDQPQLTDAAVLIVLCGDTSAWRDSFDMCWAQVTQTVRTAARLRAIDAYRDDPQKQRDEAMRSGGMAAQTLMLAAASLGVDSCPIGGIDFELVAHVIRLPPEHVIVMCIALGSAICQPPPRPGQVSRLQAVFENTF
ncbi:MAG: nitroreductase [Myxococcaceae bacterium]|nr:nitroreductase [Myxococcaceae bacterium]